MIALRRDPVALLPNAKYAYDKNRRNENRYGDRDKAKKKSGLRERSEHQIQKQWTEMEQVSERGWPGCRQRASHDATTVTGTDEPSHSG